MGAVLPPHLTLQSAQSEKNKWRDKALVPRPAWRWRSAEGFVSVGTGSDKEPDKPQTPSQDSTSFPKLEMPNNSVPIPK